MLYEEFKEQLERNPAGWYETRLSWKANQTDLPTNEAGSIRRLEQLVRRLHRDGQYEEYGNILQEQLQQEIIEPVPDVVCEKEFYIPQKGVSRVDAESFMMPPREKRATSHP